MKRIPYKAAQAFNRYVGGLIHNLAKALNVITKGKLAPNVVTLTLLSLHLPIAALILANHLVWAGIALATLGLLDTIDGELARIQRRVTDIGGLLDAVSDRIKELVIYGALIYLFASRLESPLLILVTFVACGTSLITPYIKAKGEMIITTYGHELAYDRLSRIFRVGAISYGLRIGLLSVGLVIGHAALHWVLLGIATYGILKLLERLFAIVGITPHN
jgi:phosphatidylglycerophosphate synthase